MEANHHAIKDSKVIKDREINYSHGLSPGVHELARQTTQLLLFLHHEKCSGQRYLLVGRAAV
jgi:hypothetical protein